MLKGPRSTEEMARFPLAVSWQHEMSTSDGEVTAEDGYLWLNSMIDWPVRQIAGTAATETIKLRGDSGRGPFYLLGMPVIVNGIRRLRIDDLRVGSDDPNELLFSATPIYDYANAVVSYYMRDGAARSPNDPLDVPTLDGAPAMSLLYAPRANGFPIELRCESGASIEQFETQLDAVQRLITFATQQASTRQLLTVRNRTGTEIEFYREVAVTPRPAKSVDYRDFPLRLSRANTQTIVDRWWAMMNDLRPIPQIVTALKYQPGYLDSDFLLLATVLDRLSDAWTNVPGLLSAEQHEGMKEAASRLNVPEQFKVDNRPVFHARVVALLDTLGDKVWEKVRIDRDSWLASMKRHRNLVAHSSEQRQAHREFMTGPGLRALRAATDVIVTLVVAQHLGIEGDALAFAADRLNVNRIKVHETYILAFNNNGIAHPQR
jgi:hypothetical protein